MSGTQSSPQTQAQIKARRAASKLAAWARRLRDSAVRRIRLSRRTLSVDAAIIKHQRRDHRHNLIRTHRRADLRLGQVKKLVDRQIAAEREVSR